MGDSKEQMTQFHQQIMILKKKIGDSNYKD